MTRLQTRTKCRAAEASDTLVRLTLEEAGGTDKAYFSFESSDVLRVRNLVHGGNVNLEAEDAGGTLRTLFDGDPDKPNTRGLALITYVQWLGSWLDEYPYYEELESIESEGY